MPPTMRQILVSPNPPEKATNSPLGIYSSQYKVKASEKGSILDQPELGLLEFYPAGYTKPDQQGNSRQEIYQVLYEMTVASFKESQLYPIGKDTHNVALFTDFDNPHDKCAMTVHLEIHNITSPLYRFNGRDIGFVPMKISHVLAPNRQMISQGRILKVRNAVHGKYYSAKVILSYGDTKFSGLDRTSSTRFSSIMDE